MLSKKAGPLGMTAAAIDVGIQKKTNKKQKNQLWIDNANNLKQRDEYYDEDVIIHEDSGILMKGITKTIENE